MGNPKVSVVIVVGTRPEAIKLVPLILALRESEIFRPLVVSTGQHHRMVEEVLNLADIQPDYNLWVGGARSQLNDRIREVMGRLDDFCREEFKADGTVHEDGRVREGKYPMAILVHGDTTSAMAAALASFHLRIPVVHVEAGLRSGNSLTPFPEEMNRQIITCVACFHLAPTSKNLENLIREDVPVEQVLVTGNTGIDALHWAAGLQTEISDPDLRDLYHSDRRIVVVTAHRRENWESGIDEIADGIKRLAEAHEEVSFVVAQHPNPMVREKWSVLKGLDNVLLTEPAPYAEFAKLLARSIFVITDSGGIQEEAPSLGKPVLVARESTERVEGVEAGTLVLTGPDSDTIFSEGTRLLTDEEAYRRISEARNPYGDGQAARRIVEALRNLYDGGPVPEQFGAGYSRRAVVEAAGYSFEDLPQPRLDPGKLPGHSRGLREERPMDEIWPDSQEIASTAGEGQPVG
jgi:UDP-N-acetylglucosamine 2-epimerase (non-hydrolysing)